MARQKIVVAMMMHETNTFSPVRTPLASFRPLAGAAAIEEFRDTNTQLGGFLHVAHEMGAEVVVPIAGGAHPSGYVEKARVRGHVRRDRGRHPERLRRGVPRAARRDGGRARGRRRGRAPAPHPRGGAAPCRSRWASISTRT